VTAPAKAPVDPLTSLIYGFRASQTVYVMAKLGVADELSGGPLTAFELAPIRRLSDRIDLLEGKPV
jgi:hypothetical protein